MSAESYCWMRRYTKEAGRRLVWWQARARAWKQAAKLRHHLWTDEQEFHGLTVEYANRELDRANAAEARCAMAEVDRNLFKARWEEAKSGLAEAEANMEMMRKEREADIEHFARIMKWLRSRDNVGLSDLGTGGWWADRIERGEHLK